MLASASPDFLVLLLGVFASCSIVLACVTVRRTLELMAAPARTTSGRRPECTCSVRWVVLNVTTPPHTSRGSSRARSVPRSLRAANALPKRLPSPVLAR